VKVIRKLLKTMVLVLFDL